MGNYFRGSTKRPSSELYETLELIVIPEGGENPFYNTLHLPPSFCSTWNTVVYIFSNMFWYEGNGKQGKSVVIRCPF
jgi:hypothetical protein